MITPIYTHTCHYSLCLVYVEVPVHFGSFFWVLGVCEHDVELT